MHSGQHMRRTQKVAQGNMLERHKGISIEAKKSEGARAMPGA